MNKNGVKGVNQILLVFFLVSLTVLIPQAKALADNASQVDIGAYWFHDRYNPYSYERVGGTSDAGPTLAHAAYAASNFQGVATARADGTSLGVYGRGKVTQNPGWFGWQTWVTASFSDIVTFSQSGTINLSYQLDGSNWKNRQDSEPSHEIQVGFILDPQDGWEHSYVFDYITSYCITPTEPDWDLGGFTGTLTPIDTTTHSPFIVSAGTPYKLTLRLSGLLTFSPDFTGYSDVYGGFDFLNTLTLTDFYLTDQDGNRVPFTYTSSSGITYPSTGPFPISIDIKPGSDSNCFNQNEKGVIPAAILGSADFDVTQIDIQSLGLQGLSVKVAGKSNNYLAHYDDVNGDGYTDLVVQFQDSDQWTASGNGYASITGMLSDGTAIQGQDLICIVP